MKQLLKKAGILFAFSLSLLTGYAQDSLNNKMLVDDFNTYIRYVEQTHPDPYSAYGGRVEFRRAAQDARNSIDGSTTREQFVEMLSGFIARLGDGHTIIHSTGNNHNEDIPDELLPFRLKTATDGIFIIQATKEYAQYIGSKIISVNNLSVDSLLEKVKKIRPVENRYGEFYELCTLISNKRDAEMLFGKFLNLPLHIQAVNGEHRTIQVTYIEKPDWLTIGSKIQLKEENNLLYGQMLGGESNVGYFVWNSISSREMIEDVAKNSPKYLDMNLNSFYKHIAKMPRPENNEAAINGIPELYSTFADLLKVMKSQKSDYLIIDLRENGGGMTPLCLPLLYMVYGDKYLNYNCPAEYDRMLSPLLLKKWNVESIEQYNESNKTHFQQGDLLFGKFFDNNAGQTLEVKRKDLSLITYFGGLGREYTENLNGKPIYEPHIIVLCSPKTFSASYHFLYFLTQIGHATLVGVPSRQAGNTFMETTDFELPGTKITGSISNGLQIFFPDDPVKGKVLMPDFAMKWSDYSRYNFDKNAEILYTLDLITQRKIKQ
jgi:hypothetical protein